MYLIWCQVGFQIVCRFNSWYNISSDVFDVWPWDSVFFSCFAHLHEIIRVIIMGDWNAKIGDKAVEGISGTHGLGDRNKAGERIMEFCVANQPIVTNTWYKQSRRRLCTRTSPDGLHRNQIDYRWVYILIQKRLRSMVKSAKTMLGSDCGTDHELLDANIQVKLKKTKNLR